MGVNRSRSIELYKYENYFNQRQPPALNHVEGRACLDRNLQRDDRGPCHAPHAQSGRRPTGRPDSSRRAGQSRLRLPFGALRILEEGTAGDATPLGNVRENFTTAGLLESEVNIGDLFRIGEAEVMVTQPRMPCYKLGIKFGRMDILKRFLASGRTGFYFSVIREGEVAAGDAIVPLGQDKHDVKVADITRLYARDRDDLEMMRRAIEVEALPDGWRDYFRQRLEK